MTDQARPGRSEGTEPEWIRCGPCRALTYGKRFERELRVCPSCGHHGRVGPELRVRQLLDPGSATEVEVAGTVADPLGFADLRPYPDRHAEAVARSGRDTGVLAVRGRIDGHPVVLAVMDFAFLGGSLGTAEGEAVTAAAEAALAGRTPLIVVAASGGARMQEGALSLMQMAKTSNAFAALDEAGLLTITVVTDPTYGGVAASFATLSDVVIAEPGARMGFAGPRVIRQTIRQELPEGFQTAEFLLAHGLVDRVVRRSELRQTLGRLVAMSRDDDGAPSAEAPQGVVWTDPDRMPAEIAAREPREVVGLARMPQRPTTLDHAGHWLDGFIELHGDRAGADCPAVVGGLGWLGGRPVVLVGHQKGHTTAELVRRKFGMPSPAGFRKAGRLFRLAAKLGLPVVTLIDTPGADPGLQAEEQGQAIAVAESLRLMGRLPVPVVAVVTGEGGSGGALALGVADRVLMCANSIYSVISPEGCAAILWKRPDAAADAARALRIAAADLLRLGVVDGVVPEPPGGAHTDPAAAAELVHRAVAAAVAELADRKPEELLRHRFERFRQFGVAPTGGTETSV
ncbi:acetyl-CoA carboxylase, carboxyltransferase subunit beta [Couchioplanes caeruleus]|uniref:Multifunctional fusion protein n=3 Tax=Couchioplanes caeruleus TaxID=56438 RepID=A0A1K0GFY6_9ACTN|nr:acetyl-CoA carboxylase, carboxyltransferase subunit beta [Couchioplanes caeruleus]OJF16194.1 acyl-CoA carboxyl transferase [Couchioplanes caeruleus subsp. caeruleus]